MSLIQQERRQGLYMKISSGMISYTADKDDPNAVEVKYEDSITKEQKVTYKVKVPSLLGKIVGANYKTSNYGTNLELSIQNGIEVGILQIKIKSSLHNAIVNQLMNIDVSKDVTISAWLWNDRTYVGFEQSGERIAPKNTKEHSEAPDVIKKEEFGEVKWDFTAVTKYYYEYILNVFSKKLDGIEPPVQQQPQDNIKDVQAKVDSLHSPFETSPPPPEPPIDAMESDQLPF